MLEISGQTCLVAILYGGMQTAKIRTGRDFLISWWQVYGVGLVGAACCPQMRNKGRLVEVSASLALWVSDPSLLAHVKAGWHICLCVRMEEGLGVGYCDMEGLLAQKTNRNKIQINGCR